MDLLDVPWAKSYNFNLINGSKVIRINYYTHKRGPRSLCHRTIFLSSWVFFFFGFSFILHLIQWNQMEKPFGKLSLLIIMQLFVSVLFNLFWFSIEFVCLSNFGEIFKFVSYSFQFKHNHFCLIFWNNHETFSPKIHTTAHNVGV